MSFAWSEYLALAQEIVESSSLRASLEARQRSTISRSYYAAFCSARNYLRDVDGDASIPTRGVHEYVRAAYQNNPALTRRQIGSWLDHLWKWRVQADYFDTFLGLAPTTSASLIEARRVLQNLAREVAR